MRQGLRVGVPFTSSMTDIDIRYAAMKAMQAVGATDIRDFEETSTTQADHDRWGRKPLKVFTATAIREVHADTSS